MFVKQMDNIHDTKLLFTRRQALRMQASFAPTTPTRRGGYRESLRSSPGLCPTLRIISQSGTLPTIVYAGDQTDYRFRPFSISASCGGTILYHWEATGGWSVTYPDQFYPQIIPTGSSASTITLTATYTNAQGFSFPLTPVRHRVNFGPPPYAADDTEYASAVGTPVFTSAAAALCAGSSYAAAVAPVAGASGYLWTVPAGFTYLGQPIPTTGQITTPGPNLTIIPTTALAGGIYLLQCQALATNFTPSAMASVPLTVNGGPRYQIVDADAYQRTAQGIVCQRNRIFLQLVPVGPTVPGAVNIIPPNNATWNSIPAPPRATALTSTDGRVAYFTPDVPNQPFTVTATYSNPCSGLPDITTNPIESYTATTALAGTASLDHGNGNIYSCGTYYYPRTPSAPYPNPATGSLHLPGYQGTVVVYDHQGQPVQRLPAPGTEAGAALDTSAWPDGLYVVTGRNLLGEWQRQNVQIQH